MGKITVVIKSKKKLTAKISAPIPSLNFSREVQNISGFAMLVCNSAPDCIVGNAEIIEIEEGV